MMDKFYAWHKFSRCKTARPENPRRVFGAAELSRQNAAGSDSPRAQKGTQKYGMYLPNFVKSLKNFPIIFHKVHIN